MANVAVDEDQQWLINCLSATLDPNQEIRSFAEASLDQAALQPGFGKGLSKVVANRVLPFGLRQLAALILKQFIKKHWQEGDESFQHPAVSSDEKAVIRRLLLSTLDDPSRKLCTAISMAIASIAVYDWPESWLDLLDFLLKLIGDQSDLNGVHGGLRCLALLSGDLDDTIIPTLVPVLFPRLYTIVSSSQIYNKYLRTKALSIVYACTSMLGAMSGVYQVEANALMEPMLKPWVDQFSLILEHPVQPEDSDDWSTRMEVLKCLNQFVQNFPSFTESLFMVIVEPLWQTFVSSLRVYTRSAIEGTEDPYEGSYDSDGAEKSLDSFVVQLFEFLLTIVGSTKLVKVVANNISELVYYTIAFLQVTEQQIHMWSTDVNQFVADEDDVTYSCRVSGALLLEEVATCCGEKGIDAIISAAGRRFSESQQEKAGGSVVWWRLREATLFALASLSEQLLEAEVSGLKKVSLGNLLEQVVTEDMGIGVHEYPFLYARMFISVAKFSSVISSGILEHFLHTAMKTIGMDVPPAVKVGACRALSQLLPEANKSTIQPQMMGLLSSLTDLLHQTSDETLHLVLETLQAAIKAGHESSASAEPIISPIILNMWVLHISDPFISIDAIEVLEAIKNTPGCFLPLASRILPYIGPVLNKRQQQPDGLVAGSLDLLTMLLKNAPTDVVKAAYDACFDAIIRIILESDDHSEMQNATECLASFVSGGRKELLAWGSDSGFTMRSLLDAASRLLDPDLESSGSLFVGSYILQLILHLPSQMGQHIQNLIVALVRRMQSASIAGLRSSLLLIFARLIHLSVPNVEQFINLLLTIPAEGYQNAFVYVMSEWTKQQGEIQGAYQIKVTTSALALLLSTKHPELTNINVQGHLIKSMSGITTRSKAKSAPDQWTIMPLPAKILALLADALIEIQEQAQDAEDEDSDWEEIHGDMDADKDLLSSAAAAAPFGKSGYEHLEVMAKVYNENQEDDYEDDTLNVADPLNEINLANYLTDFLSKFYQSDRQLFDNLCQSLTPAEQDAIKIVLNR
ncbi:importin-9-like [Hibiscus syriacus]|uniref:importin-9-like n=1 Tax=Hibiscus syriacus TaxID=106335 RepID=UPI001920C98B|nr:importin-9-like [Hibiscus syriacus]XP_039044694.1 importin-9-like [Hibiscus syriacus]